jgi:hypothetical protein
MKRYIRSDDVDNISADFRIKDGVLVDYLSNNDTVVIPRGVKRIGAQAFWMNRDLVSVVIPEGVTAIEYGAFFSCDNLQRVKFPSTLKSISKDAFDQCLSLITADIPDGVVEIGEEAFKLCKMLQKVHLPDGLVRIREACFYGCYALKSINIPNTVKRIDGGAFAQCKSLEEVGLHPGIFIDVGAFGHCDNLKTAGVRTDYTSGAYIWPDVNHSADDDGDHDDDDDRDDEEEMTFDELYQDGSDSGYFSELLEELVRKNYDVVDYFNEASVPGYQGSDHIAITLADGNVYTFDIDYTEELEAIYEDGDEDAAQSYFEQIKEGIDSGAALSK